LIIIHFSSCHGKSSMRCHLTNCSPVMRAWFSYSLACLGMGYYSTLDIQRDGCISPYIVVQKKANRLSLLSSQNSEARSPQVLASRLPVPKVTLVGSTIR